MLDLLAMGGSDVSAAEHDEEDGEENEEHAREALAQAQRHLPLRVRPVRPAKAPLPARLLVDAHRILPVPNPVVTRRRPERQVGSLVAPRIPP